MTSRRSQAYGRVLAAMARFGPAKLHATEDELIRDAADTLLFVEADDDPQARAALERAAELVERLVAAGRLEPDPARELIEHLAAVGPPGVTAAIAP